MLERHGKVADINETLQAFQVLRAFGCGKMNGCRAANSFDNVMRVLKDFKIAHPASGEYPRGTTIGNVESIRQVAYKSDAVERWSPFSDIVAVFFVISSLSKAELAEIVKLIAKKIGKDFKDVSMRDFCIEKKTIFNEVDKVTAGTGHLELDHIKMARRKTVI
jgi:hypothetical protein